MAIISVKPNYLGLLYEDMKFIRTLEPGIHWLWSFSKKIDVIEISQNEQLITVINQEVLTSDLIALRFSYHLTYKVSNLEKLRTSFDIFTYKQIPLTHVESWVHIISQEKIRDVISKITSEELNGVRERITAETSFNLKEQFGNKGLELITFGVRDITFPKNIQEILSKSLEAKVRAKTELENARTQIAVSRALKNASDLMKDNKEIKFLQLLETMEKISKHGNHTFVIGDKVISEQVG